MTLQELLSFVRKKTRDTLEPFFWQDEELVEWINEALNDAAIRGRLCHASAAQEIIIPADGVLEPVFTLPKQVYEITGAWIYGNGGCGEKRKSLHILSTEILDEKIRGWREMIGDPEWLIQFDNQFRIAPVVPGKEYNLYLEGYREPAYLESMDDEPEIHPSHHVHLLDGVLAKAYLIPDSQIFDRDAAKFYADRFSQYFGLPYDCNMRVKTREDVPHVNSVFWA